MLAGEYAVLEGHPCLASTVCDQMTMTISFEPTSDRHHIGPIHITSDLWQRPIWAQGVDDLPENERISHALRWFLLQWPEHFAGVGLHLHVDQGIPVTSGFGSSSALTLAVMTGLLAFQRQGTLDEQGFELAADLAFHSQHSFQSLASGYDILTQMVGGLVYLPRIEGRSELWPRSWQSLKPPDKPWDQMLHIVVGPLGNATKTTMTTMMNWFASENQWHQHLTEINRLTACFLACLKPSSQSWQDLIDQVGLCRRLLESSPAFPCEVASLLAKIEGLDRCWTYKTTGAGGQDALLLVGTDRAVAPAIETLVSAGWHYDNRGLSRHRIQMEVTLANPTH